MPVRYLVVAALCLSATPALADSGVRPIWTDFQPAVATQYRPPDGGRGYPKPDTKKLISAADRRASERQADEMNRRAAQPLPGRDRPVLPPVGGASDPLSTPNVVPPPAPAR